MTLDEEARLEAVGLDVVPIRRLRIGRVVLAKMPVGTWRYLPEGGRIKARPGYSVRVTSPPCSARNSAASCCCCVDSECTTTALPPLATAERTAWI